MLLANPISTLRPSTPSSQSYHRFMREHLFDHVDLAPSATHLPHGTTPLADVPAACDAYERGIEAAGGIDLQASGAEGLGA